jgi:RNA polymerase sigma-70 factor (ECF subfamily)
VVTAFLRASLSGELDALLPLLDPSVVLRADGGGRVAAAGRPVEGADQVAKVVLAGRTWYPGLAGRIAAVNGGTGALMTVDGDVVAVVGVTVAGGLITAIDMVVNPEKLTRAHEAWPSS